MKKIVLFLGMVVVMCGQAMAQDTLTMNVPPNNYFYDVWPSEDTIGVNYYGFDPDIGHAVESGLRFFTKDTLQVYGLAVMLKLFRDYRPPVITYIDTTTDSIYGFMKLYEAETDSLRTIGQLKVHLHDTPIAYYLQWQKYDINPDYTWPDLHLLEPMAVQEVYFDTSITVTDSFYVGYRYDRQYRVDQYTYSSPYSLALRAFYSNHWRDICPQQALYFVTGLNSGYWRYTTGTNVSVYLLFPILTPDTTTAPGDDSLSVQVSPVDRLVAVQPNPATERVKVLSSCGMERVTAYDATGRKVHEQSASGFSTTLNVQGWPAGTYILHIQTPLGISTKRLVVAR